MSFRKDQEDMHSAADEVRLSEEEIRARASSLRRTPSTAERASATVSSGLLGVGSKVLKLLRIPLFIFYAVAAFLVTQESMGWVLALGAALVIAVILSIVTTIIARQMELYSIKRRVV